MGSAGSWPNSRLSPGRFGTASPAVCAFPVRQSRLPLGPRLPHQRRPASDVRRCRRRRPPHKLSSPATTRTSASACRCDSASLIPEMEITWHRPASTQRDIATTPPSSLAMICRRRITLSASYRPLPSSVPNMANRKSLSLCFGTWNHKPSIRMHLRHLDSTYRASLFLDLTRAGQSAQATWLIGTLGLVSCMHTQEYQPLTVTSANEPSAV